MAVGRWEFGSGMSCAACKKMHKIKDTDPPCDECKRPELLKSNYGIYSLISKYLNLFVNGFGGISAEGIRLALDVEQVQTCDRPLFVRKISAFVVAIGEKNGERYKTQTEN